jgi:hypothetical protein
MKKEFLRVIFDTNVYPQLLEETELRRIEKLVNKGDIFVCGCRIIRDELRDIPTNILYGKNKNYRNLVLSIYDRVVGKRNYPVGI